MPDPSAPALPAPFVDRVQRLIQAGGRVLLGLTGPPGAGKSTLALSVQQTFAPLAQVVPMDGFHLASTELARLGRSHRKGAPDTFDSAGYVALLRRLRSQRPDETVYAPEFRREIEEPVAGAIAVTASTRLVITEGNYLLLEEGHWAAVGPLLDEVWFVDIDPVVRQDRLLKRHERYGRTADEALEWARTTDEPNARRIQATRGRAHACFRWGDG
jgi:pantothenate kinase